MVALIDALIGFVISLLVGAAGIYVGARVLTMVDNPRYAVVTALIGSVVWFVVAFFLGWIPYLGPLLALVAYVGVINWRYPGGWPRAAAIALLAWGVAVVAVYVLASVGIGSFDAIGIPGT